MEGPPRADRPTDERRRGQRVTDGNGSRSRRLESRRRIFSEVLKSLRIMRGERATDVAGRMGLERRTYERFESGEVRAEVERLIQLAEALGGDPVAILCAVYLENPALAAVCADNKLMTVVAHGLERLNRRFGDRIRELETAFIMEVFDTAFDVLGQKLQQRIGGDQQ